MTRPKPRRVAIFLYPDFEILDVCGPLDVFATANRLASSPRYRPYDIQLLAQEIGPVASSAGAELVARRNLRGLRGDVHTLLIPGGVDISILDQASTLAWIQRTAKRSERVVSVCSGARVLAAAGLLDGRRVTTHWESCSQLASDCPQVTVESDALFVQDGKFWTSAGITAGIDLALALVELDHGKKLALATARELVVFFKRPGGQKQFSAQLSAQVDAGPELEQVVDWIHEHLTDDLSVERLADRAHLSPRHFARLFRSQLGDTPARYVERLRVEAARTLFDDGAESFGDVARATGLGSIERMRRSFERHLGVAPSEYRRMHGSRGTC